MLIKIDTGQTATKTQGYMSSPGLTVKEMKPSLSASIYTEYISQMYSVYEGHINWKKAAGEHGKENFNAFGRCWYFLSTYRTNSLGTHNILKNGSVYFYKFLKGQRSFYLLFMSF